MWSCFVIKALGHWAGEQLPAHNQLLCDVSVQPYSVSTLVLQPGMQPEVLLLTLFFRLTVCGKVARNQWTLLYTLFLSEILSIGLGFARSMSVVSFVLQRTAPATFCNAYWL